MGPIASTHTILVMVRRYEGGLQIIMLDLTHLLVRSDRDKVICNWRAELLMPSNVMGEGVLPDVLHMTTVDLSFYAYTLGKEAGSGHYCPYCPLTKTQWTTPLDIQPSAELWTLDSLQEIDCDSSKKGPQKLSRCQVNTKNRTH